MFKHMFQQRLISASQRCWRYKDETRGREASRLHRAIGIPIKR